MTLIINKIRCITIRTKFMPKFLHFGAMSYVQKNFSPGS